MKNETRENISVEQNKFSILLTTEQTTVQKEVFPSIEDARGSKRLEYWKLKGLAASFGTGGIICGLEGIGLMVSGTISRNYLEALVGSQIVVLGGALFLQNGNIATESMKLAKRQLDKLKSFRS